MGTGSGLQDVSFHSGLGLPGVTGRAGSGSTSLKGRDVPGTGALAARIGLIPLGSRRDGQARSTGELSAQMPNGIPAQRADERAGDLMAKLDGQGGGQRNPNGRDVEGNLPGMALDWPWLGGDRLGARMGEGRDDIARDGSGSTLHPSNDHISQSIHPQISESGGSNPLIVVKPQVRDPHLVGRWDGNNVALLMIDSTGDGPIHGGVAWRVESRDDSDPEPDAVGCRGARPALVPDVAGPTIRSKGDGRPTKSPPRPRINPEGTCCAVNVVGCGGAEAAGAVVGCGVTEAVGAVVGCGGAEGAGAVVGCGGAEAAGAVVGCGGAEGVGAVVGCGGAEAAGDAGLSAAIPIIGGWTSLRESAGP